MGSFFGGASSWPEAPITLMAVNAVGGTIIDLSKGYLENAHIKTHRTAACNFNCTFPIGLPTSAGKQIVIGKKDSKAQNGGFSGAGIHCALLQETDIKSHKLQFVYNPMQTCLQGI